MWSFGVNDQALYHNVPAPLLNIASPWDGITKGSDYIQRLGNSINVKFVQYSFLLNRKLDRPNVSYRIVATATLGNAGATDTFAEQFLTSSSVTPLNAPPLPGVARVLYDRIIPGGQYSVTPITSGGTGKERTDHIRFNLPINAPVQYTLDGISVTRLHVWIVAYDSFGTLTTDNIASVPNAVVTTYFTDE